MMKSMSPLKSSKQFYDSTAGEIIMQTKIYQQNSDRAAEAKFLYTSYNMSKMYVFLIVILEYLMVPSFVVTSYNCVKSIQLICA